MAFYLKYRPQTVEELDCEAARESLKKILSAANLPHALLFSGPKGLGKTSAARILAKAINCEKPVYPERSRREPCNRCETCQSITAGTSLDVIEIDGASNRGIDDIRDLRETIKLAPSQLKYKVYVIDEVHMLTSEAFNALLKTLEEPPKHAVFVLATTQAYKLPDTIVSRCIRVNFKKATTAEIIRSLSKIVSGEKLKVDREALEKISRLSDGSFRDAAKFLEQLSFSGIVIKGPDVDKLAGQADFPVQDWLEVILKKNSAASIEMLEKALASGVDLKWLISQALENLKALILSRLGEGTTELELVKLAKLLDRAAVESKTSFLSQLPIELAIIEWSRLRPDVHRDYGGQAGQAEKKEIKPTKTTLADVTANWEKLLKSLRPHNNSIEALLRSTRPVSLENGVLTIEVFYKFHKERLETGKCLAILQEVFNKMFGEDLKIKCILGSRPKTKVDLEELENIFVGG